MVTGRSLRFENVAISWRSWTSTPPGLSTEPALRATHQSRSQRTAPQVRTQRSPNRPIATPSSVKMPVTTWSLTFFCACSPRLNLRPSCSSPPPQVIQALCHSRELQRSKAWLEVGQRRGLRIPCEVPGVPIFYQKGSGGPQKPFSSLSDGVTGRFTIITEAGERLVSRTFTSSGPQPCHRGPTANCDDIDPYACTPQTSVPW